MPPKPFRLDSILMYRKRLENLAQEQYIQAQAAAEKASQSLDRARRELVGLIHSLEERQRAGIMAQDLGRFEARIAYDRRQVQLLENILSERQETSQRRRAQLLEKARDYQVLNTLKEKQNLAWKTYLDKKESAMLDEIAILRHDRNIN